MNISLEDLGNRICIIGPSSSGKSTLAQSLSNSLSIPCYHLDQYAHIPNTDWVRKSDKELSDAHNEIIKTSEWIIEGNYSFLMHERFRMATSVIWIDPNLLGSMIRYIKRTFFEKNNRYGHLDGTKDKFNPALIKYTFMNYPKNRIKYEAILTENNNLKKLHIKNISTLNKYYQFWKIKRM